MEEIKNITGILDLMVRPAFCVKGGEIRYVNQAAQSYMITAGTQLGELLATGTEEYTGFSGGCLYLTLQLAGHGCGAEVTRFEGFDVFVLDQQSEEPELKAMALAAQELRDPLSGLIAVADKMFSQLDAQNHGQAAQMNRSLFQLQRIISNMSDASSYTQNAAPPQEVRNITAVFREIFDRAQELIAHADITLRFSTQCGSIYCIADEPRLERAVFNILSNSAKFTPKGGSIEARLTQRGSKLYLTVQDSGPGIPENIQNSVFSRYLRGPGVEDGRFGIGLGMVLIRAVAAAHGGTVLMEHPRDSGTRITMTIAIRESRSSMVRSSTHPYDYAGHRDHGLLELSEILPWDLYDTDSVN